MDIRKLQRLIVDALEDVKAQDIRVYNTTGLTQLFDRVIIASGTSNRQTKALAASVRDQVKQAGGQIISMEGEDVGEWVLVDLGDAVVHIMQPAIRAYYNLEEIWGVKPVNLKTEGGVTGKETAPAKLARKRALVAAGEKPVRGTTAARKSPAAGAPASPRPARPATRKSTSPKSTSRK